jgi:uncharacterized protein
MNSSLPFGSTGDDQPFWDAANDGRLTFQQCDDCAYVRWPASGVCPECLSRSSAWREFDGIGTVWSHVVYHRAYSARVKDDIPYRVVLAELDCGVKLLGRVVDVATQVAVGDRLRVVFADPGDGRKIPAFERVTPNPL